MAENLLGALAQALGGLGQGIDYNEQTRQQRQEQARAEKESKLRERQQMIAEFQEQLGLIGPQDEIDRSTLGELTNKGSMLGLDVRHMFQPGANGMARRRALPGEELEMLNLGERREDIADKDVLREFMRQFRGGEIDLAGMDENTRRFETARMGLPQVTTVEEDTRAAWRAPSVLAQQVGNAGMNQNQRAQRIESRLDKYRNRDTGRFHVSPEDRIGSIAPPPELLDWVGRAIDAETSGQPIPAPPGPAAPRDLGPSVFERIGNWFSGSGGTDAPPSGGQTRTLAQVQRFAEDNGLSLQEAMNIARQEGFTVVR